MSGPPRKSWDNDPNAPEIPPQVYLYEKSKFAGFISCAIFYGITTILFFRCISALSNPINRKRGGLRQLLVVHTAVMFLCVTVHTAINLNIATTSYVNNREFPGTDELRPGPLGYQSLAYYQTTGLISTVMFLLNNWLADGLLLYRCYIIYAMNCWAISFPCLLYLATFATGVALIYYQASHPSCTIWRSSAISIGIPHTISVSLNALITFMIIARLVLLTREIQHAMNGPFRLNGLYKAVITVLSESSALYAITFLLFIGTWAADNPLEYFFWPILAQTQVIAPFLIVLRVANRTTVTSDVVYGDIGSVRIIQEESVDGGEAPPGGYLVDSATGERTPTALCSASVTTVDLLHKKT